MNPHSIEWASCDVHSSQTPDNNALTQQVGASCMIIEHPHDQDIVRICVLIPDESQSVRGKILENLSSATGKSPTISKKAPFFANGDTTEEE